MGLALAQEKKVLRVATDRTRRIEIAKAEPEESRKRLSSALLGDTREISTTLSNVDYNEYMHAFVDLLERMEDTSTATDAANQLSECLARIGAPERVKARAKRQHDNP